VGCPSPVAIERAALSSVRQVVVPGFARAGIDVMAALRWIDEAAS
jgi:hypothetical protein